MAADRTDATPNVEWFRMQAKRFSALAAIAIVPEVKVRLLEIVREYEQLADTAEKRRGEDG